MGSLPRPLFIGEKNMTTLLEPPKLLEDLYYPSYSLWLNRDSYKEFLDSQVFVNTVIETLEEFKISKTTEEVFKVILSISVQEEAELISSQLLSVLQEIKESLEDKSIPSFIK